MPFGQIRVVDGEIVVEGATVVDGRVVEGTLVEGTVVEGTVVDDDCGAVVVENGVVEGVVEGEMPGVWPTMPASGARIAERGRRADGAAELARRGAGDAGGRGHRAGRHANSTGCRGRCTGRGGAGAWRADLRKRRECCEGRGEQKR